MPRITDASLKALKSKIIAAMRLHNIDSIHIEYSGSGDDGCINSISYDPKPTTHLFIVMDGTEIPLSNFVTYFADSLIDSEHNDYEDGEGGEGTITITQKPAKVRWTHSDFFVKRSTLRYTA